MIKNHTDYAKPYFVIVNEDNTFYYDKLKESSVLSSRMNINTFAEKQDMINFIEQNNKTFIEFEL
jgi:hypothetical protein